MPGATIDRLSVVGPWRRGLASRIEQYAALERLLSGREFKRAGCSYGYTDGIEFEGVHVSFSEKENLPAVRVDCNPNVSDPDAILSALALIREGQRRVTRVDVALDYTGVDLGVFRFAVPRMKTRVIATAGGDVQTQYVGYGGGRRSFRVYDKANELGVPGQEWWRIEAQQRVRPRDIGMPANLFDSLEGMGYPDASVPFADRVRVHYLLTGGDMAGASKSTRKRYRDLARAISKPLDPVPRDVYLEARPDLLERLDGLGVVLPA